MQSFRDWIERPEEVPDIGNPVMLIARSGGISLDGLRKSVRISSDVNERRLEIPLSLGKIE